jgi:Leucine-rich repeat (LRR) protein
MLPLVPLVHLTEHALRVVRHASVKLLTILFAALTMSSVSYAVIPDTERAVLLALFTSTNGDAWTNKTNWNGAPGTECTWFGVTCNADQSHVTGINLSSNNLSGSLPTTLDQLTALQFFFVNDNQLTGSIPSLTGLTALQTFIVNDNQLTGSIPSLSGLTALQNFDVGANQLTGSIPALTGLTALQIFFAGGNQLTGSIPSLTGLTALQTFFVDGNQLTGSIPSLTGLTALQLFFVGGNQLTGSIPSLTGLTALQSFNVDVNQLTGSIPSLAGLTALQNFSARANLLTGSIPSLTDLTALVFFIASNNQLTGSIPSLTGLTALQIFIVSNNQLTGPIPAVPSPSALIAGLSQLCPNQLTVSPDADWDAATPGTTWDVDCTAALPQQVLSFGAAPTLVVGGTGTVVATVSPSPGSTAPIVYSSATPSVCSVDTASGLVTVLPAAVVSDVCRIAADKANDETINSAVQVLQNITIQAASAVNFTVTPSTADANGTINPNTAQTVVSGNTATFTITPNTGFNIASVDGTCGGALIGNSFTTNAVVADCTVIASFVAVAATTFTVTPSAVDPNGSINPNTPQTVASGNTATFIITPNAGFFIAGVTGSCGGTLTGNSFTTNPITADCTVNPSFALIPVATGEVAVPTLSQWALMLLALLAIALAALALGTQRTHRGDEVQLPAPQVS